jgi:hypothetical protein
VPITLFLSGEGDFNGIRVGGFIKLAREMFARSVLMPMDENNRSVFLSFPLVKHPTLGASEVFTFVDGNPTTHFVHLQPTIIRQILPEIAANELVVLIGRRKVYFGTEISSNLR